MRGLSEARQAGRHGVPSELGRSDPLQAAPSLRVWARVCVCPSEYGEGGSGAAREKWSTTPGNSRPWPRTVAESAVRDRGGVSQVAGPR